VELAVGQREGRRRSSGVGSYRPLIGRPATNSLNYRLRFLASLRGTGTLPPPCPRLSVRLLIPLFALSLTSAVLSARRVRPFASLFPFLALPFRIQARESPEKSSVDLITRNNPRGCEAWPRVSGKFSPEAASRHRFRHLPRAAIRSADYYRR